MRVLIADDHRLIVEGVKLKLSELGAGTEFVVAMDVDQLRTALQQRPLPDIALIDLAMPGASGYRHLTEILRDYPEMPVVVLSGSENPTLMQQLIDLGAHGFVPKAYSPDVMLSAVRLVLSGGVYVPPMALQRGGPEPSGTEVEAEHPDAEVSGQAIEDRLGEVLTERQMDVLRLLSQGKPNKVIARDLGISEGTVKIHLAAIFRALNVRNRVEAVVASQHFGEM